MRSVHLSCPHILNSPNRRLKTALGCKVTWEAKTKHSYTFPRSGGPERTFPFLHAPTPAWRNERTSSWDQVKAGPPEPSSRANTRPCSSVPVDTLWCLCVHPNRSATHGLAVCSPRGLSLRPRLLYCLRFPQQMSHHQLQPPGVSQAPLLQLHKSSSLG